MRQDTRDLGEMIEIVRNPGGEELPQRDDAQRRVASATIQICVGDAERVELTQALLAQSAKLVEQMWKRKPLRVFELRQPIERLEGALA